MVFFFYLEQSVWSRVQASLPATRLPLEISLLEFSFCICEGNLARLRYGETDKPGEDLGFVSALFCRLKTPS